MSRNWENWPPNFFIFIGYTGLNTVVSGLEVMIGAYMLSSYGFESYEHLAGRDGFNLGALSGAIQVPCMATLFWPCSLILNPQEHNRMLRERDMCKLMLCLWVISIVMLGSNVASAYALGAERDIGRLIACHFVSPLFGVYHAIQAENILNNGRRFAVLAEEGENTDNTRNVTQTVAL